MPRSVVEAGHRHTAPCSGESRTFHFESRWNVDGDLERVWGAISDVVEWPDWWPGIRVLALDGCGAGDVVGNRVSLAAHSPVGVRLLFDVELTAVQRRHRMEFSATGDLRGHGSWTFSGAGGSTGMEIVWCVVSHRLPVRLLRPVATWAHDRLMARGEAGLQERLAR